MIISFRGKCLLQRRCLFVIISFRGKTLTRRDVSKVAGADREQLKENVQAFFKKVAGKAA